MKLTKSDKKKLDIKASECAKEFRKMWELKDGPIKEFYSLVKSKEFLLLRFPNDNSISGMFIEKKDYNKIWKCIYINNNEPLGRQSFTLAHELYHVYFEKSNEGICFAKNRYKDPIEFTAERFASHLLMPREHLLRILKSIYLKNNGNILYINDLFQIQKIFQVSFQAVVYVMDDLKNDADYREFTAENINDFTKYYKSAYWDELSELTLKNDSNNYLNTSNPKYEFPEEFKKNLIRNYEIGRVDLEDIEEIFDFFDEELYI